MSTYLELQITNQKCPVDHRSRIHFIQSLCDIIPIMDLLEEMKSPRFKVICANPHVFCKTFEDNSVALQLACLPKIQPYYETYAPVVPWFAVRIVSVRVSIRIRVRINASASYQKHKPILTLIPLLLSVTIQPIFMSATTNRCSIPISP